MKKCFLIARSNMRRAKGQTAAIIVLVLLAALVLNLGLILSTDYKANFDRYHDELNAEDITLSIDRNNGEPAEFISQLLKGEERIAQYQLEDCLHMAGTFPYNGGEMNGWFVCMEKQAALTREIGRIEIVEEGDLTSGIYLPMLYRSDEIAIGKPIKVSIGNYTDQYTVCGFFNSVMMGSHNCSLTQLVFTADQYAKLDEQGLVPKATLCSIRMKNPSETLTYEAIVKSKVSEQFPSVNMVSNSYDIVVQSRYISQSICASIMNIMALLVLVIALVVIVSNIFNYIQVNMKKMGVLKAVGYTSFQLIGVLLFQFLESSLIAALVGAALSYILLPAVNTMMMAQTGIPYQLHFLPWPLTITLVVLGGAVALAVWLSAWKIRKIEPIVALRAGVQTHNFKRNHMPLERTRTPLHCALALKTTLSSVKHNVTVCITMLLISLIVVFSGLMTENVIADMTPFLNLIVGETPDSCINMQLEDEAKFLQAMNTDSRVEKVYLYHTINTSHVGGAELMTTICDDFSKVSNQSVVFDGRFPRYDNEIAIAAKYAKEKGFQIGDEIEITANGKTEIYLISGFTQISNYLGRDALLTRQGYEKLGSLTNTSYYLDLTDETDIDAFNAEIKEWLGSSVNTTINGKTTVDGSAGVYVSLMTVIVAAILLLSAIVIAFVLYLLVRTMLNIKKRDYGIMKSLGFTTGQLIVQTALSFMPAVILSTVVGLIASSLTINPLMGVFLSDIGIVKCTFSVPAGFIVISGVGLVLIAFVTVCLLSLKIRKITPRALLSGE